MTALPGLGRIPDSWRIEKARWLVERQRRAVRCSDEVVTAFRDGQVTLRKNRRVDGFTEAVQEIGYQGVREGDLVIHSMDGFAGAIGVSESDGKMSPVVHCYTAREGVDIRYVAHLLRHLALSGYISTLAKGIRERSTAFDSATFADLLLPVPPVEEQRRIADFLDAELESVAELRRLQHVAIGLLRDRRLALIDDILESEARGKCIPLKYIADLVDTEHKTAPHVVGGGYWIAGTSAIRDGRIEFDKLYETDARSYREWTRRATPKAGDILLSREAPVGQAAIYGVEDPPVAIGQRVVLVRPREGYVVSGILLWALLARRTREFVSLVTQGSLHPHLNMRDIGNIPIPTVHHSRRLDVSMQISAEVGHIEKLIAMKTELVDRLNERQRALIVAAVTGQIDVGTARRPGA